MKRERGRETNGRQSEAGRPKEEGQGMKPEQSGNSPNRKGQGNSKPKRITDNPKGKGAERNSCGKEGSRINLSRTRRATGKRATANSLRPRNNQQAAHPRAPTFANVGKYPPDPALSAPSFDEQPFTFYMTVIVCSYGIPFSPGFHPVPPPINSGRSYARMPETR